MKAYTLLALLPFVACNYDVTVHHYDQVQFARGHDVGIVQEGNIVTRLCVFEGPATINEVCASGMNSQTGKFTSLQARIGQDSPVRDFANLKIMNELLKEVKVLPNDDDKLPDDI